MRTDLSHLKQKAITLRLEGNSYGYIKKTLGLKSKGTLTIWFKGLIIPREAKKRLEKNNLLLLKDGYSLLILKELQKFKSKIN